MRSVAALSTHALEGRPTLGYEPGMYVRLASTATGRCAYCTNQTFIEVFGMLARRKKAFCGDGQPISEVYLSFLQSDVGTRAYSQMGCRGHITPRT